MSISRQKVGREVGTVLSDLWRRYRGSVASALLAYFLKTAVAGQSGAVPSPDGPVTVELPLCPSCGQVTLTAGAGSTERIP